MDNILALAQKIQQNVDGKSQEAPKLKFSPSSYYNDYSEYQEVFVDPASIALMSTVILNVIKLIKVCRNDSSQAVQVVHKPNLLQRRALKRAIREELGVEEFALRSKYYKEIMKQGTQITESEMEGLYDDHDAYSTMEYRDNSGDST